MSFLRGITLLTFAIPHALSYSPVGHNVGFSQEQIPLNGKEESPFSKEFNDLVSSTLDHWHVPGLSITIVDNNSTFSKVIPPLPSLLHKHSPSHVDLPGLRHIHLPLSARHALYPLLHRLHHQSLHSRRRRPPNRRLYPSHLPLRFVP